MQLNLSAVGAVATELLRLAAIGLAALAAGAIIDLLLQLVPK